MAFIEGLVSIMILNFLFGLLSAFSPCLFPLLPTYVATTLRSDNSRLKIFISSLFLILGLLTVFLLIGTISNLIGTFLLNNYVLFARIQGALLILAGIFIGYREALEHALTERGHQEFGERLVGVVEPAPEGNAVGLVDDFRVGGARQVLERSLAQQRGMQRRDAVDAMRAEIGELRHADQLAAVLVHQRDIGEEIRVG